MPAHALIVIISSEPNDWGKVCDAHKALASTFNASWSSWKLFPPVRDTNSSTADIVFACRPAGDFDQLIDGAITAEREILVAGHPRDLRTFTVKPSWLVTEFHHMSDDPIW